MHTRSLWSVSLIVMLAACGGDGAEKKGGGGAGAGGTAGGGGAGGGAGLDGGGGSGGTGTPPYELTASVEILRDTNGVPHLYAENDLDLFYAYGYQLASDRLWQLDNFRLSAQGRRAEVLGKDYPGTIGTTVVDDDKLARMFNPPAWGAKDLELMRTEEPERVELINAWRSGINRRIQEVIDGTVPRPFGYEDLDWTPELWTEVDPWSVMWMARLVQDQTLLFKVLVTIIRIFPTNPFDHIQLFRPARAVFGVPQEERPAGATGMRQLPGARGAGMSVPLPPGLLSSQDWLRGFARYTRSGSNNWAVAGEHTDNGMPLLAGDPHLGFNQSGFTYALHLNSKDKGGSYNVAGFAFVSAAGILGGRTENLIWSPTSTVGDVMDLVAVDVKDGKATVEGKTVELQERQETILVRDQDDVVVTIQDVPGYGVIFPPEFAGVPIDLAGTGREALVLYTGFKARTARWFLELNKAQTRDEFDDAMLRIPEMSYSPVAADKNGITLRVGLEVPARNPIQPNGREPWAIMDGGDPLSYWPEGKSLTPDQLPHSRGGSQGYLVTANNDPFGFTEDGDPSNDPYYYGSFFAPGFRAGRIDAELQRLIASGKKLTLADMQALQTDVHSNAADDLIPLLEAAWAKVGTDPDLAEFQGDADLQTLHDLLSGWDREMTPDSPAALVYHLWAHLMVVNLVEDEITPLVLDRVFQAAPFYLVKIVALALKGAYPDASPVMQKPGTMGEIGSADWHLLRGLKDAAEWLHSKFGGVDPGGYRFSDMKVSNFSDGYGIGVPLDSVPSPGAETTVNVSQSRFRNSGEQVAAQWESHWGPIHRMVGRFTAAGKPELYFAMPYGNVADRNSPHFKDRMNDYEAGKYVKMPFDRADVEAALEETITLEP